MADEPPITSPYMDDPTEEEEILSGNAPKETSEVTVLGSGGARDDIPDKEETLDKYTTTTEKEPTGKIELVKDASGRVIGLKTVSSEGQTQKVQALTPQEQAAFGLSEDSETKELEDQLSGLGDQINDLYDELDGIKQSYDDASADLIDSIKDRYDQRRIEMNDIYKRHEASLRVYGIRGGTARYAPALMTDIVTGVERARLREITKLDQEELGLIAEAKQAQTDKKWSMLASTIDKLEAVRDKKVTELKDLQADAQSENDKIRERMEEISRQSSILSFIGEGVTQPDKIFGLINSNEDLLPVTMDEVENVLDIMVKDQIEDTEEIVDKYTDMDGNRIHIIKDKITGSVKEVTMESKVGVKSNLEYVKGIGFVDTSKGYVQVVQPESSIPGKISETIIDLRTKIRQEPLYGDAIEIKNGYTNVDTGHNLNNAQGDLMIVNGIAKMLDPGSVIRPAEFDTVEEAQGFFQRFKISFKKWTEGDRLHPDARKAFKDGADEMLIAKLEPFSNLVSNVYKPLANSRGISIDQIIDDTEFGLPSSIKGKLKSGEIKVKRKSDGQIGAIPENEFDPDIHEKVEQ